MARRTAGEVVRLAEFNPARWASQATRDIDLGDCISALVAVLSASADGWDAALDDEAARRKLVRDCATALRDSAPLFELTAALIAPWLVENSDALLSTNGAQTPDVA